jgi:hypothetical protein
MTDNPGNDETIQAKRRRQGASSGPQGGERAEEHYRQQPQGGGPGLPFGRGGGRGNLPRLPIWAVLLLIVAFFICRLLFPDFLAPPSENGVQEYPTSVPEQISEAPAEPVQAAPATIVTKPPASQPQQASVPGQKWTVMLYQDADDRILEQDIYFDLNEVESVGSSDRVQIVSQIDRYKGAFTGDGNWTSTRRYYITRDNDLQVVHSELVSNLGELDMADGNTLTDFVVWAANTYPADKYILILSDHGMGWPGGFSDGDPAVQDPSRAPLASALGDDQLYLNELEKSLAASFQKANIDKFELIGLDACLMSHIEVLSALQPYARYAVLSQETEPALGWAYASFLQTLVDNPDMTGADLSQQIVASYIEDDQRVTDDQARADFLRQGSPMGGLFGQSNQISAASLARELEQSVTLTAVDLSAVPALLDSLNTLAYDFQSEDQDVIARSRTYAPSFTNIFGKNSPSPYIDLGGFVQMLKREGANSQTGQAAAQVLASLKDAVIAEKHGPGKSGANGISIYFPNSTLYRSPISGPQSYTAIASTFAKETLWDDFLVFFYNDVGFDRQPAQAVAPQFGPPSRTPGLGQIEVSPITLSNKTAAPGSPITVSTKIKGTNIGYIYLFVGVYDKNANSVFEADTDFLESSNSQQLNGVFYPQWSANRSFNLEFDWDPTVFQITDGQNTSVALFNPASYGASAQDAVYTVDGIYQYANGDSLSARLYFRNGVMQHVFGFTDQNETGGAREIIPQAGDRFTILEKWLDLNASGQVTQTAEQQGATLTFGSQPFKWKEVYAAPGQYLIGIIVQDLDGNSQEAYTTVTVR